MSQQKMIVLIWWATVFFSMGSFGSTLAHLPKKFHHDDEELKTRFLHILEYPTPFQNEKEMSDCKKLVEALDEDELILAARTSYAYWYLQQHANDCLSSTMTQMAAAKEARRHLVASYGNFNKALDRLREACHCRKENNVDGLRLCFQRNDLQESSSANLQLRERVQSDMRSQPVVMIGHDKDRRAVLVKGSRLNGGGTEAEYLATQIYIAERANACNEFVSNGRQEKMVAVFDFSTYQSAYSPPMKWQLSAIKTIQKMYPERLHKLILLEPPFWMRGVYHSIRSFLPKATKQKIHLISDRKDLPQHLDIGSLFPSPSEEFVEDMEEGSSIQGLMKSLDVDYYLHDVPFYCPYDCEKYTNKVDLDA